jgi:hypothetical protein
MRECWLSLTHKSIPCTQLRKHALFRPLGSPYPQDIAWPQDAPPTHPVPPPPRPPQTALPATGGNATGKEPVKEPAIIVRAEDAADEGARAREPANKRARKMAGAAGGEPTAVGRREEEPALKEVIDAPSATEAAAHRGGGAPEQGWCRGGASQACEKSP